MQSQRILVVDDEQAIADLVEIHLLSEGYEVHKADSGAEALRLLAETEMHLVILDIMMPGMDGLEVCRAIRRKQNIPIMMLSAKAEDMDKILGLKTGADDYMTKPFNPLELVARVKAQLRRCFALNPALAGAEPGEVVAVRGLAIDRAKHEVMVDGRPVTLTPREYEILLLMAGSPGRVFSSEEIFERVWKERFFQSNNTVMVHMRRLREKIEDDPSHPTFIKTIWGVGYKLAD